MVSVYIVDEEYHFAQNVASALRLEGYEAHVFQDATDALEFFRENAGTLHHDNVRLLIYVSLAPGDDVETFNNQSTDDFMRTGLVLVEKLMVDVPGLCTQNNTVLYTAHFATELWETIEQFCHRHHLRNWQKVPNAEPEDVVKLVEC